MTVPAWWVPYVGLPFADGGRDLSGVDCWGLVRLVYAREIGIDLPAYGEISAADLLRVAHAMRAGALSDHWRAVAAPGAFDVVLMRASTGGQMVVHVGVMADSRRVLHAEPAAGSALVPVDHYTIRGRIAGYRRYAA